MNLTGIINDVRNSHYNLNDDGSASFDEAGVDFIRSLLACDRLVQSVNPGCYDAILVTDQEESFPPEVGERFYGEVFFDKKNRFKDGSFIIVGTVKEVISLHTEITLVKTSRTNYLVIQ